MKIGVETFKDWSVHCKTGRCTSRLVDAFKIGQCFQDWSMLSRRVDALQNWSMISRLVDAPED